MLCLSLVFFTTDERQDNEFFHPFPDFDCILTTVSLERIDRKTLRLRPDDETRINNILKRVLDMEKGVLADDSNVNPDHPDGRE